MVWCQVAPSLTRYYSQPIRSQPVYGLPCVGGFELIMQWEAKMQLVL